MIIWKLELKKSIFIPDLKVLFGLDFDNQKRTNVEVTYRIAEEVPS